MLPENFPVLSRIRTWVQDQFLAVGVALAKGASTFPGPPRVENPSSTAWYAGMVIAPTDFSQQLCNLQVSLQGAGAPVTEEVLQTVKSA